jgi:hypothetical protein
LKALGAPARPVEYCSRVGEVVVAEERAAALRDGPEW